MKKWVYHFPQFVLLGTPASFLSILFIKSSSNLKIISKHYNNWNRINFLLKKINRMKEIEKVENRDNAHLMVHKKRQERLKEFQIIF